MDRKQMCIANMQYKTKAEPAVFFNELHATNFDRGFDLDL